MSRSQRRRGAGKNYFHWLGPKCFHCGVIQDRPPCCCDPNFQRLISCACCPPVSDQPRCSASPASPWHPACDLASLWQKEIRMVVLRSSPWSLTSHSLTVLWLKQASWPHLSSAGQGGIILCPAGRAPHGETIDVLNNNTIYHKEPYHQSHLVPRDQNKEFGVKITFTKNWQSPVKKPNSI